MGVCLLWSMVFIADSANHSIPLINGRAFILQKDMNLPKHRLTWEIHLVTSPKHKQANKQDINLIQTIASRDLIRSVLVVEYGLYSTTVKLFHSFSPID